MNRISISVYGMMLKMEQTVNYVTGTHLRTLAVDRLVWGPIQRLSWVIRDPFERDVR